MRDIFDKLVFIGETVLAVVLGFCIWAYMFSVEIEVSAMANNTQHPSTTKCHHIGDMKYSQFRKLPTCKSE